MIIYNKPRCPNCSKVLDDAARACQHCGITPQKVAEGRAMVERIAAAQAEAEKVARQRQAAFAAEMNRRAGVRPEKAPYPLVTQAKRRRGK